MVPPEDGCKECSLKLQHLGGGTGAGRPIESAYVGTFKLNVVPLLFRFLPPTISEKSVSNGQ